MSGYLTPGAHLQTCADDTCPGCYPDPRALVAVSDASARLSETRRLTLRRQALLAAGIHPATRQPLLRGTSETCGGCAHAVLTHGGARSYWKCDTVEVTRGAGTDLRKSWPACLRFEPRATS